MLNVFRKSKSLLAAFCSLVCVLSLGACSRPSSSETVSLKIFSSGLDGGHVVNGVNEVSQSTVMIFLYDDHKKVPEFECTGSLISKDLVVTAAHCVGQGEHEDQPLNEHQSFFVKSGLDFSRKSYRLEDFADATSKRVYKDQIKIHPGYTPSLDGGILDQSKPARDIALFHLVDGAPSGVAPATLLSNPALISNLGRITIAGYGPPTNTKMAGSVRLRQKTARIKNLRAGLLDEVALRNTKKAATTEGDSGGPAFIALDGQQLLWGLCSSGGPGEGDNYEVILRDWKWVKEAAAELKADTNFKLAPTEAVSSQTSKSE